MNVSVPIALSEWSSVTPARDARLQGLSFNATPRARALVEQLRQRKRLQVVELHDGIAITTHSFVGALTIGPLRILIEPKIPGDALLRLLRYAYGLRQLDLYATHAGTVASACFQDLLLYQLAAEVQELLSRGLHRRYQEQRASLAMPRGRIDFRRLVVAGGTATAELPCRYHERDEDCFPNRVLLAGVRFAAKLAIDPVLATRLRQLARFLEDRVGTILLEPAVLTRLRREENRLLAAYAPAFELIALLAHDIGATATAESKEAIELPGFLFDMNRFFERLMERFLTEHLPDCQVLGQQTLRGLFTYDRDHNPLGRQAPRPRPDFVIKAPGGRTAVLDAKYRDLWGDSLPREMLYQLAIYTLGGLGGGVAAILYPTTAVDATEQRVRVREPLQGNVVGTVALRPVMVEHLADLVMARPTAQVMEQRRALAAKLVWGGS